MQLLIDSTQETPASLRFIAATLCALADTYGPPIESLLTEAQQPSINGPQSPIVLHAHSPAAPIDPAPVATTDVAQMDPAVVFGQFKPFDVPAGTLQPHVSREFHDGQPIPLAPPAPTAPNTTNVVPLVASPAFVAPAPPTVPAAVSAVTTTAADTPSVAPVAANTQAPNTAAAGTAFDSERMPWDARVHSETRKTNTDGTWRYRRNLDATVKAAVIAELRAAFPKLVNTGQMSLAPPPPGATGTTHVPAEAPPAPVAPQPPTAPVPVPDGVPMGLPVAPQPGVLPALGFRDFMSAVNKALAANKLTQDQLTQACKAENLDGITALAGEPMKISLVHARIATLL